MSEIIEKRPAWFRVYPWVALLMALGGCQTARVAQPLTGKLAGNDADSQMEFWHTLAVRPVTSNDEAFHGLLLYLDSKDDAATYADRVAELRRRDMLPPDFHAPADIAITRGDLAVSLVKIMDLKGGWALHVLKNSPHYCLRELEFEGVYPASSDFQTFSGAEFLGIIGKLEDSQAERVASNK